MTRSELVDAIAARNRHLYRNDVERIVSAIIDGITESLEEGNRVELRGFGVFSIRHREAREGRNPRCGSPVAIGEKWAPAFHIGRTLHRRLNPPEPPETE